MDRLLIVFAAVSGFMAVVLGAFGAHYLKNRLEPAALSAFETAVMYQMFHTLALLLFAMLVARFPEESLFRWAAYALITGIILFSGSLYGLSIAGYKFLGPVTPLGGLAFLTGWLLMGVAAFRHL